MSYQTVTTLVGSYSQPVYHNAFTHSTELVKVVEAGLFGAGLIAVVVGFGLRALINSFKKPKRPLQPP